MSRYDVKSIARSNLPIGGAPTTTSKPKPFSASKEQVQFLSGASNTLTFSKPIKQDHHHHQMVDYWSLLGFHTSTLSPILESSFPFRTATNFTMDFSSASTGFLSQPHPTNGSTSNNSSSDSVPFATLNGLNSSDSCYEVSGYSSWAAAAAPSLHHSFQVAKSSLSVFQTSI